MGTIVTTALEAKVSEALVDVSVSVDNVARSLANKIASDHIDYILDDDEIDAAVTAAIEEIDDATFAFAVDVIRDRMSQQIQTQAKKIALRLLRETAAKAERSAAACSPDGGM